MLTTVSAEFRKIRTLPSACVAVVAGTAFTLFIVASSARNQAGRLAAGEPTYYASDDLALSLSAPGVIGVIVLGIVIMSSEYTATGKDAGGGRQIPATLTAIPGGPGSWRPRRSCSPSSARSSPPSPSARRS